MLDWQGVVMLWAVAAVTFVLWIVVFTVFHTAGGLVHLVLVVAMAAALYDLLTDRRRMI